MMQKKHFYIDRKIIRIALLCLRLIPVVLAVSGDGASLGAPAVLG